MKIKTVTNGHNICINCVPENINESFMLGVEACKLKEVGASVAWPDNGGVLSIDVKLSIDVRIADKPQ